MYINERVFREWWSIFHSDGDLTEIRLLGKKGKKISNASGYFYDCELALEAIRNCPFDAGVYSPFNAIKNSCSGREQRDCLIDGASTTTSDNDIEGRRWILIDIDPVRSSGTNASEEEVAYAKAMASNVGIFLRDQGFKSPVIANSSNGIHLYYRVNIANTADRTDLIKNFLLVLDMYFSDNHCSIDTSVFNAARIAKVISTKSNKGANTSDRPQRESFFIRVPDFIECTDISIVEKVAGLLPVKEQPSRFNGYSPTFNIEDFIRDHGIEIAKRVRFSQGEKLVLRECPFDPNHKAPDAALFIMDNGAIGFKCLHNSCQQYTWRDVRLHFDPNAYSQRDRDEFERKRDFLSTQPRPDPIVLDEDDERGKKWKSLKDIEWQDPSKLTYIPTGIAELDKKMGGLCLCDVTVISGVAGAGKTSIINFIMLNAIQHGYKVAIWSGELSPSRFKSWFNQAAAGANMVKRGAGETEYYYCPKDIGEKIDEWTDGKVFLYNNDYGNKSSQIIEDIKGCVKDNHTQLVVLDNKMAMMLDSFGGDKNEKDAGLINELKDFAMSSQIHIILVCHPRKEQMNSLLRMESISGSSDLYNAAANVLLCHRVGRDFEKRATEFFGKDYVADIMNNGYDEVIEIAKNRTHGAKDFVCGLYFEYKTRRFLNTRSEYLVFGWQPADYVPIPQVSEWTRSEIDSYYQQTNNEDEEDLPF